MMPSRTNTTSSGIFSPLASVVRLAPKVGLWVAITAGGAIIGAAASAYWNRGQPDIRLEHVSITEIYNDLFQNTSQVQVPTDEVITRLRDHKWTGSIGGSSLPIADFMENLQNNERRLTDLIQSLERYGGSRDKLRGLLDEPVTKVNAERFFAAWEPNDGFLWGSVRGEYRRGAYEIPQKFVTADENEWYSGEPFLRLHKINTDDGELYLVNIPGGGFLILH